MEIRAESGGADGDAEVMEPDGPAFRLRGRMMPIADLIR
jgi:hypothetical protein